MYGSYRQHLLFFMENQKNKKIIGKLYTLQFHCIFPLLCMESLTG